jgi:hypothetical protein
VTTHSNADQREARSHPSQAWLPIRTTTFDDEVTAAFVDAGIQFFLANLPDTLPCIFPEITTVRVDVLEPPAHLSAHITRGSSIYKPPLFQCARIMATVIAPRRQEIEDASDLHYEYSDAAYYLGRALDIALDLSELSQPGCIWAVSGPVVVNDGIYAETTKKGFFNALHPQAEFPSEWPPVCRIPLLKVVTWARDIGMLASPLAESRLQRTLAAFTNLVGLQLHSEGEALFRAMQALEAFYCDGVGDLRRQISEKVKLWLGPGSATTNIVGQLYDLRSKYIHGSAKLRYRHETADPWDHDEKSMKSLSAGTSFAARLLVATLQRCILENVTDLEWAFDVRTQAPPPPRPTTHH